MTYGQATYRNPGVEQPSIKAGFLPGIFLLFGLLLVLAGCGGSGGSDAQDGSNDLDPAHSVLPPDPDGMLLRGLGTDNAVAAIRSLAPSPVGADHIDDGLLTTRLAAVIAADATVDEVNAALASEGAAIVSMIESDPFVMLVIDAVSDRAEAQAKADALVNTGAFVYARPGLMSNRGNVALAVPRPGPAGAAPNFTNTAARLPDQEAIDFIPHLLPSRLPAAWKFRDLADQRAGLLLPQWFAEVPGYIEIPQLEFSEYGGSAVPADDLLYGGGNAGFFYAGVAAANWAFEDVIPHTGADPVAETLLDVLALHTYGLDDSEILGNIALSLSELPSLERVVLLSTFTFDDPDAEFISLIDRARMAFRWRRMLHGFMGSPELLYVVAAGAPVEEVTNPLTDAFANNPFAIATARDLRAIAALGGSSDEFEAFQAEYDADVALEPRIGQPLQNVLIIGSSEADGTEAENSMPGSELRLVGAGTIGPCLVGNIANCFSPVSMRYGSSTAAAAQAAGLAAYLWHLDGELTTAELALRLQHAYSASGLPGVLDAWIAVLSLDRDLASARLRRALLDVSGPGGQPDGAFTEHDIQALLDAFDAFAGALDPDWSDYDLNGDGRTGGSGLARMDLDVNDLPGFTEVPQTVNGQEKLFDETAVSDAEVLCYYAWSELYSGNPVSRSGIPDCGAGFAVEHNELSVFIEADPDEGDQSTILVVDQPSGNRSVSAFGDWNPSGTDVQVEEAGFADVVWNEEFNPNTLSLQRFSYRFDARAIATVSGSSLNGNYSARIRTRSVTTLRFTVKVPVDISITGTGSGNNFTTNLSLIGNSVLYEVDETLISVPISYNSRLSPGHYWLSIDPSIVIEASLDSPGTASQTGEGFLELTVEFN